MTQSETGKDSEVTAFLRTELVAKDKQILDASVENARLKAELDTVKSTHASLLKIAAASVANMKVALGLSAVDMSASGAEQVLAEHAVTAAQFNKSFVAGGVAATVPKTEVDATKQDPHYMRRVQATRFAQTK